MSDNGALERLAKEMQQGWKAIEGMPEESMNEGDWPDCELEFSYCIDHMVNEILSLRKKVAELEQK